jgi:hypothetical protein
MSARHPLGEVTHLRRYPVKSLLRESLRSARAGRDGFEGDRRSALFVATPGHAREGRPYRGKEHHPPHTVASVAQAEDLAAERGPALETRGDGPHFSAAPISLVLDTWVAELEGLAGMPLDPQRPPRNRAAARERSRSETGSPLRIHRRYQRETSSSRLPRALIDRSLPLSKFFIEVFNVAHAQHTGRRRLSSFGAGDVRFFHFAAADRTGRRRGSVSL